MTLAILIPTSVAVLAVLAWVGRLIWRTRTRKKVQAAVSEAVQAALSAKARKIVAKALEDQLAYEEAHGIRQTARLHEKVAGHRLDHHHQGEKRSRSHGQYDDDQRVLSVTMRAAYAYTSAGETPPENLSTLVEEALDA